MLPTLAALGEKMISLVFQFKTTKLNHKVLVTFFTGVACIINSRPLVSVLSDPNPFILTTAILLTQKAGPLQDPARILPVSDLDNHQ